jgi:acetyl-CoA carboxylase biotin carboxylase subunit
VAKIITYGKDRPASLARMGNALDELIIEGIKTNTDLQRELVTDAGFKQGCVNIHYLEKRLGL